ncbi:MAG: hypothetical protein ACE5JM_15355, partial [Armatimonadota bacterium]
MRRWLSHGNVPVADVCCVALIVTVLTASFLPIFTSLRKFPEYPSANDWFKECAFNRSAREAIVRHHQFPLRSQYLGGGYPLLAYPEDSSLSPLFLTTLLFGENVGLKVRAFLKLLVGGLGMYYLLRAGLSCPPGAAVIGALLLALSGWFHHKTGVGYLGCQNYYFLPLLMALVLQAAQGRRSVVLPSLIFAVMLVDGKFVVPASLLFLLAWGMLELVQVRRGGIVLRFGFLRTLAAVACAGSLVAMVKVLPMLTLLQANPRVVSYAALGRWWRAYATVFYQPGELWTALVGPGGPKQGEMSLGWVPLVLAALSIVRHPRSVWRWALLLALSAWLCMGYWAPVDLWRLLWHWPVFGSINKPALWMNFLIVLPLCVLAASLFRQAPRSRRTRAVYGAYLCVGAVGTALLLHNAYRLNASSFTRLLEVRPRAGPFYSVTGNGKHYTYQNMLQNVGSIDWDGDILLPEHAVPRLIYGPDGVARHNESYRDEVWLARGNGRVRLKRFTPNAIDLDVECQGAGTVVVNQNLHPGWRSSEGEVLSHEGLLAIGKLPARGRRTVRLRYVPVPFYVGLAVSLLTLAVVARIGMRRIRAVGRR